MGLSVNSEYIACGSETNEVFVYHKVSNVQSNIHRTRIISISLEIKRSHFILSETERILFRIPHACNLDTIKLSFGVYHVGNLEACDLA